MVQRRVRTLSALREIGGVGEARAQKYGKEFLGILQPEGPADNGTGETG